MATGSFDTSEITVIITPQSDYNVILQQPDEYRVIVNSDGSTTVVRPVTITNIQPLDRFIEYAGTASYTETSISSSYSYFSSESAASITASYSEVSSGSLYSVTSDSSSYAQIAALALTNLGTVESASYVRSAQFAENVKGPLGNYANATTGSFVSLYSSGSESDTLGVRRNWIGSSTVEFTGSVVTGLYGISMDVPPLMSTASYAGCIVDYIATNASGSRIGTVMSTWLSGQITHTDVSSADIGNTEDLQFNFVISGENAKMRITSLGVGGQSWTVQTLFKMFPVL